MEERIVERMKLNQELTNNFTEKELKNFLEILSSNEADNKKIEKFMKLIKGGDN